MIRAIIPPDINSIHVYLTFEFPEEFPFPLLEKTPNKIFQ